MDRPDRGRRRRRAEGAAADAAPLLGLGLGSSSSSGGGGGGGQVGKRVMLVIAHPDDETMFFTPVLDDLRRRGDVLFLLCCSTGNFYGEGEQRRAELVAAAELLGIGAGRVEVIDHPELQDGPDKMWSPALLGRLIREASERHRIDEIVTFDTGGVSGHPNHGALAEALAQTPTSDLPQPIWTLRTTCLVRKYLGPLDVPLSFLQARVAATETRVALNARPWLAYSAMLAHASQFVWYRRLFVIFSRYTYVNTLVALERVSGGGPGGPGGAGAAAARGRRNTRRAASKTKKDQ